MQPGVSLVLISISMLACVSSLWMLCRRCRQDSLIIRDLTSNIRVVPVLHSEIQAVASEIQVIQVQAQPMVPDLPIN